MQLFFILTLFYIVISYTNISADNDLKTIINKVIAFREDGKINIPGDIKHVKLDIGLSYSAPMSEHWLSNEDNLIVFGFEPNPASVNSILSGAVKQHISHGEPLKKKYIGKKFFLIPCALGISSSKIVKFFVTSKDCGCSSLYLPKEIELERVIEVPIFSLAEFFDLFPFDSHPVIDYIKIDAQGADLDIVKSAQNYLKERVVYITLEPENTEYVNTINSEQDIYRYMTSIGFVPFVSPDVNDPTYFNPKFADYVKNNNIKIYQKG